MTMEQIQPDHWAVMYFGLVFLINCALMLVVYALSSANNPTPGLGLYTVYFMASLLGWIAFTLQQGARIPMAVDVPSVISIIISYLLFLAAGQRAGIKWGRYLLGLVCLITSLSVLVLPPHQMFVLHTASAGIFFAATGLLCSWRSWKKSNLGDGITAAAALMMVIGMPIALYQSEVLGHTTQAQTVAFGVYCSAYGLVAVGFLASVLIEYQQNLSHLATEDPLTGLLNRRGLEQSLNIILAHAARQLWPTSAIMVDIDHLKGVNDNFGNDAGDQVVKQVAQFLQRLSRASDVLARTGGEEYLLILPQTDLEGARILAERIRTAISAQPLVAHQQRIPITVSLGVAGAIGEIDLDKLSQEADRAMYLAKRGGSNRVASVESKPIHLSANVSRA